jgi:hypothetical protein
MPALLAASVPARPTFADSGSTLPPFTNLCTAAYGNGTYVVAGGSACLTSTDAANWTLQSPNCTLSTDQTPNYASILGKTSPITGIAYGNNLFAAVGAGPLMTSGDGAHWNPDSAVSGVSISVYGDFASIVYGNGTFVLLGPGNSYTSKDGVNWAPIPDPPFAGRTSRLIFGNGVFVDFKGDGTQVATSRDGINWQIQDTGILDAYKNNPISIGFPTVSVAGLVYGNGMYVAVGMFEQGGVPQGDNPIIITSPDAVKWTMKMLTYTSYYDWYIRQLAFGNGIFTAIDRDGDIMTSPDGMTWMLQDTEARGSYDYTSFVSGAAIEDWDSGGKIDYSTIYFCGDRFVALGSGTISTSEDGINWTNWQSNPVAFPAQIPIKFVVGCTYYYLGPKAESMPMMDAAPYIDSNSGRTLVPVRYLAIALGAIMYWDAKTQTITITKGNNIISMVIGSTTLTVNGQKQMMDVAPEISGGRTYLPAKYVAEALGFTVSWDAGSQTVTVK